MSAITEHDSWNDNPTQDDRETLFLAFSAIMFVLRVSVFEASNDAQILALVMFFFNVVENNFLTKTVNMVLVPLVGANGQVRNVVKLWLGFRRFAVHGGIRLVALLRSAFTALDEDFGDDFMPKPKNQMQTQVYALFTAVVKTVPKILVVQFANSILPPKPPKGAVHKRRSKNNFYKMSSPLEMEYKWYVKNVYKGKKARRMKWTIGKSRRAQQKASLKCNSTSTVSLTSASS